MYVEDLTTVQLANGSRVSVSNNGNTIAVCYNGNVIAYRYNTGTSQWSSSLLYNINEYEAAVSVSVSGDGDTIAYGIPHPSSFSFVRVHRFQGGAWVFGTSFDNIDQNTDFGRSVSLSSDGITLAVGAPGTNTVYIYNTTNNGTAVGSATTGAGSFGASVSLSGNGATVAIGSPGNDQAHIYNTTDLTFPVGTMGGNINSFFGASVSLSSDGITLAVGAPGTNMVYIYNTTDPSTPVAITDITGSGSFGTNVSLSGTGTTLAISGTDGNIWIYTSASWTTLVQTISGVGIGYAPFISGDGTTLAVGDEFVYKLDGVACFLPGTPVLTPVGYKPIETIAKGDLVTTADGRNVSVCYTTRKELAWASKRSAPYAIPAGCLGPNLPASDLVMSPDHCLHAGNDLWIPARCCKTLVEGVKPVQQILVGKPITYYNMGLPNYFTDNLVIFGGVEVESMGPRALVWEKSANAWHRKSK